MAAAFAGPLRGSTVIAEAQDVRLVTADVAVVIGVAGVLMAGETDLPADRRRRATWVLVHVDDHWRIAAYHNCPAADLTSPDPRSSASRGWWVGSEWSSSVSARTTRTRRSS